MSSPIRYVCLSDLHFGADASLLTTVHPDCAVPDPTVPSDVLVALTDCLRALVTANGAKPTLILNGDILEFALANDEDAAMVFERFAELVMRPGDELFDEILYVPGNHDHHLWETAREAQYAGYIQRQEPGARLLSPWHSTRMLLHTDEHKVGSPFLSSLLTHSRRQPSAVCTAYPTLALRAGDRLVAFHHGHFTESVYLTLTNLHRAIFPETPPPQHVWDVEEDNFAWIDFMWSGLGRCGRAGEGVEYIYDCIQEPRKEKELIARLAASLSDASDDWRFLGDIPDGMREALLRGALSYAAAYAHSIGRQAYGEGDRPLSEAQRAGLLRFVDTWLLDQIEHECAEDMPAEVTFVFGHTHSPFEDARLPFERYARPVHVYNTGGWIHETSVRQPTIGAAAVLLDGELNAVSLRLYDEVADGSPAVTAREAQASPEPSPLLGRVREMLAADPGPWKRFTETVDRVIDERCLRFSERDPSPERVLR